MWRLVRRDEYNVPCMYSFMVLCISSLSIVLGLWISLVFTRVDGLEAGACGVNHGPFLVHLVAAGLV